MKGKIKPVKEAVDPQYREGVDCYFPIETPARSIVSYYSVHDKLRFAEAQKYDRPFRQIFYKFDAEGKQTEYIGGGSTQTYKYNDRGDIIEFKVVDIHKKSRDKYAYKYDDKGNLIEKCSYCDDPTLFLYEKWTYNYDGRGNVILERQTEYDSTGEKITTYINKYDSKGNRIERYSPDILDNKEIFKYDEEGNLIEWTIIDSFTTKYLVEYDDKGNWTECKTYYNGFSADLELYEIRNYTYEYDKKGNWLRMTEFKNGKPSQIRERELEYYYV